LAKDKKIRNKYGDILDKDQLSENLAKHCIPESIFDATSDNYMDFLMARRKLMAQKIQKYYKSL